MTLFRCVARTIMPNSQTATNTLHVDVPGISDDGDANLYLDLESMINAIYIAGAPLSPNTVITTQILLYVVDLLTGQGRLVAQRTVSTPGTNATSSMLPGHCAMRIASLPPGRERQASFYYPGISRAATNSSGNFNAADMAVGVLAGLEWVTSEVGGNSGLTLQPVLWSLKDKAVYNLAPIITVNSEVDIIGRRKTGRGS